MVIQSVPPSVYHHFGLANGLNSLGNILNYTGETIKILILTDYLLLKVLKVHFGPFLDVWGTHRIVHIYFWLVFIGEYEYKIWILQWKKWFVSIYFKFKVNELSLIGGKHIKAMVKRLMTKLFIDDLLSNYSFTGKKGKKPFSSLTICSILFSEYKNVKQQTI